MYLFVEMVTQYSLSNSPTMPTRKTREGTALSLNTLHLDFKMLKFFHNSYSLLPQLRQYFADNSHLTPQLEQNTLPD